MFASKKSFLKTHNMALNIQVAEICSVIFDVHTQFAFKAAHVNAFKLIFFHVQQSHWFKIGAFHTKRFVHRQSYLKCIFNFKFFKKSMIIFAYYKMLSEWLQSAP